MEAAKAKANEALRNPFDCNVIIRQFLQKLRNTSPKILVETLSNLQQMHSDDKPNSHMIDYVYKLLRDNNVLPEPADLDDVKNDFVAEETRKYGNSLFISNPPKYVETLWWYNKSLCYGVSGESRSIALANRSAVLLKMEMFSWCLESIRLAREHGLPERLKEKLAQREAMCQAKLKDERKMDEFVPKIGLPVNEKMPSVAKCLALRKDKKYGRHLITEEDIPAGTIIAIKETFCNVLVNADKYLRCATCLAEVPHLLQPCDTCTQTMFCSKVCKENGLRDFHAIECPIRGTISKTFDYGLLHTFRTIICAFLAFPDTPTMAVATKRMDMEQKTVFNFDWSKEVSPEDLYAPIHTLITNEKQRKNDLLRSFMLYAIGGMMYNLLKNNSPTFSQRYLTNSMSEDFLKNIIFRHLLTSAMNGFGLETITNLDNGKEIEDYGFAVCGFHSLINHSCSPNIICFPTGTSYGIITIKNMKAGQQLFINYAGIHHEAMDRTERQQILRAKYEFDCQCIACTKNFPRCCGLMVKDGIPKLNIALCHKKSCLCLLSLDANVDGYQMARDYIRKYDKSTNTPIDQLCKAQEDLRTCLNILCGNISLRAKDMEGECDSSCGACGV